MPEKYQMSEIGKMSEIGQTETKQRLRRGLCSVRRRTFELTDLLTDHDLHEEFDPLTSPLVWDMGHIANFENFRVLRGASWATSPAVTRNSFRNWEYRERRQILAGVRLAWTVT